MGRGRDFSGAVCDTSGAPQERQRMKDNRRPNYGLDAPLAVRNLLIVAALGIISRTTLLLRVWSTNSITRAFTPHRLSDAVPAATGKPSAGD